MLIVTYMQVIGILYFESRYLLGKIAAGLKVKTFRATATDSTVLAANNIVKCRPQTGFQNYAGKWLELLSNSQIQL